MHQSSQSENMKRLFVIAVLSILGVKTQLECPDFEEVISKMNGCLKEGAKLAGPSEEPRRPGPGGPMSDPECHELCLMKSIGLFLENGVLDPRADEILATCGPKLGNMATHLSKAMLCLKKFGSSLDVNNLPNCGSFREFFLCTQENHDV